MSDERLKFEESQPPSFLEDEWSERPPPEMVLVKIPLETLVKLLKIQHPEETLGDLIERLLSEYALLASDES